MHREAAPIFTELWARRSLIVGSSASRYEGSGTRRAENLTSSGRTYPLVVSKVANKQTQNQKQRRKATARLQPRSFPIARYYEYVGRYFDTGILNNPGVSAASWQVFNLSSLFDPDTTGVGHQPIGFDQLMPLYDHYTVHRAEVRVTFSSADATNAQIVVLSLQDKAGTTTNAGTVIENGRCTYNVLGQRGGASQVVRLTMDVEHSAFFARSVLNGDKYMGGSTYSPTEAVYLHVGVMGLGGVDSAGANFCTEIVYHARLSEPAAVAES